MVPAKVERPKTARGQKRTAPVADVVQAPKAKEAKTTKGKEKENEKEKEKETSNGRTRTSKNQVQQEVAEGTDNEKVGNQIRRTCVDSLCCVVLICIFTSKSNFFRIIYQIPFSVTNRRPRLPKELQEKAALHRSVIEQIIH